MTTRRLDQITVRGGRRRIDEEKVQQLAQSIAEVGLLNPVTVTQDGALVAGRHRLEACRMLGWNDVPVNVVALNELQAELAMLDENLFRNEGTVLERAEWLKRRKELYEALHPQTRSGVAGALASNKAQGRQGHANEMISFASDAAAKTGVSPRAIQQEVQIARLTCYSSPGWIRIDSAR
jgi:ParB family chromosome partitioning protein